MWSVWKFSKIDISKLSIKKKRKDREMERERDEVKERVREKYRDGEAQKKKRDQYKRKIMMVTGDEKGKAVYKRVYSWIL